MSKSQTPNALAVVEGRHPKDVERSLLRLHRVAQLMDDQFELPIIKYRVGLDPLIGLIPGGGDWVTWAVSVYILWEGIKLGIPIQTILRMGFNTTVDLIAGYVPGIGDIADAVIKANKRNVQLVFDHFEASYPEQEKPQHIEIPSRALAKPRSNPIVRVGVGILLIAFLFVLAMVPVAVMWWLLNGGNT